MTQKRAIFYFLVLLFISIGLGIFISKSIRIQNPLNSLKFNNGGICIYNNSRFHFKFSYDCNNLAENHVVDYSGCITAGTCRSFNYINESNILQVTLGVSDVGNAPLCYQQNSRKEQYVMVQTMSCFGITNGEFINKTDSKYTLGSYHTPYTSEEADIIEKYKNTVHEEKVAEIAIKNNNGVTFYKLPPMSDGKEAFCAVIPKLKDPRWVCFKSDKGFDDNMKSILNNFSFY